MKILAFGNPLVEKDNLVLKILPKLKKKFPKIEFIEFDSTEELHKQIEDGKLKILDVVEGIDKVVVIDDLDKLQTSKVYSIHDFDLAHNLKLLKKVGLIEDVEIIGVPINFNDDEAVNGVGGVLNNFFKK